jgi:hypothetical protein
MENFSADLFEFDKEVEGNMTDAELKEATASTPSIEAYKRQPLTILAIESRGISETDDSWIAFSLHLGLPEWSPVKEEKDGKTKLSFVDGKGKKKMAISHYLLVPRRKTVVYMGKKGPTPFVFRNAQDFIAGLGHTLLPSTVVETVKALFSNPEALVGAVLDVQPGYETDHVAFIGDGEYAIKDKNGSLVKLFLEGIEQENKFSSRDIAEGTAIACGRDVDMKNTFLKAIKIFPAKEPFKVKKKASFDD